MIYKLMKNTAVLAVLVGMIANDVVPGRRNHFGCRAYR